MKDKQFYIDKANSILALLEEMRNQGFNTSISTTDIIFEAELLFFGFNSSYPALFDLKALKEKYLENITKGVRSDKLVKEHLLRFINFVNDYV